MRALLMGGQACVLYGAAEFSRDTDLAVLASGANLARLRLALDDLHARVIAVPPFEESRWPAAWKAQKRHRALLALARAGREPELAEALVREEWAEREADARYWQPLKAELERLRHERPPDATPPAGRGRPT